MITKRRHVQPLRSKLAFTTKASAIAALQDLSTTNEVNTPMDGEIVSVRYWEDTDEKDENGNTKKIIKSIIGLYNTNPQSGLDLTIFDNADAVNDKDLFWEEI